VATDEWSGDFSLTGGDTSNYGSFNPSDYSLTNYSPDSSPGTSWTDYSGNAPMSQYYQMGGPGGQFDTSLTGGGNINQGPGTQGPGGLGIPQPPGAMNIQPTGGGLGSPGSQAPFGGLGLQGLLGLGGAGAGLLGALMGGGVTGTAMPKMGTAQKAAINQAPQGLTPFAQGTSPLQMQQGALLNALFQGQIPPQMAQLVANAYQPQYQQAATRATDAARQAGFYDAPLSSPVGGAIMGPAAAQLQGQQANSLLGLMQTMPGLYNTPIQQQATAAGQQGTQMLQGANLGIGQQNSQPLGAQIGQAVGSGLQGMSQSIGQQNQQNFNNQLLSKIFQIQPSTPGTTGSLQ
jgi:hypothetical protein